MPFFAYKAIDNTGLVVKGFVEESNIEVAYSSITSSGLHILNVRPSSRALDLYLQKLRSWGIKNKDVIEFASNLAVMLRAGLPLTTSLSDIIETMDNKRFKSKLIDIKRSIELGTGFSIALSQHKDVFPEMFVNLIAVGEETGRLDESLSDVAIHLQRMEDLRSAIIRALMYPVFALLGTFGALLFWLIYVLPQMSELFVSMDIELPVLTKFLMVASDYSQDNWYLFFVVPVAIFAVIKMLSQIERTRYYVDAAKLRMPIVKLILHNMLLALFAEQLRILVAAGITIDRAFDIMIKVINHAVFKKALIEIRESILLGSKISDAIKEHKPLFPNLVIRMISIGESTGNLNEQLNYLSEYFLKKLDDISDKLGKLIEPIIILVIGSIFVIIILGLLSPIYDLVAGVGDK
jgi:type II secretory pathway component PulF